MGCGVVGWVTSVGIGGGMRGKMEASGAFSLRVLCDTRIMNLYPVCLLIIMSEANHDAFDVLCAFFFFFF